MVPFEILGRVYYVQASNGDGTGTSFTIDVDGQQYLVTARHVVDPAHAPATVRLLAFGDWRDVGVAGVWSPPNDIDVAVLALNERLGDGRFSSHPTMEGISWGQDTYFLGFPYSLTTQLILDEGQPMPFVKKATLSAARKDANGKDTLWLDGHVNEGFSGGPVAFQGRPGGPWKIAGITIGYYTRLSTVLMGEKETAMSVRTHTGFVLAHDIGYAVEGARALGNGPKAKD